MNMLMFLTFLLSMLFIMMSHPLSMGLMLMIQTIMVALLTNMMSNQSWFSYILFLVFVGGMLILFIYMTSIASNEKFLLMNKQKFMLMIFLSMYLVYYMKMNNNMNWFLLFNKNNFSFMNKFFNFPNYIVIIMMIIYLFITLIAVVKIINLKYGPMRQKN
uniref:NADH-ubiquinone oxidoreductase chain 6 n=1 Tax=Tyraphus nitidus TaxID=2973947 RepID=A0A976UF30_9COLE|nr:NADH dehydrogenase subunit 6 [Tyraphus nitidus]UVG40774.1 NADH dehydrogenase subunit 6 [Tyraphus nitidus]